MFEMFNALILASLFGIIIAFVSNQKAKNCLSDDEQKQTIVIFVLMVIYIVSSIGEFVWS